MESRGAKLVKMAQKRSQNDFSIEEEGLLDPPPASNNSNSKIQEVTESRQKSQNDRSIEIQDSLDPPTTSDIWDSKTQEVTESSFRSDSENGGDFSGTDSDEYKPPTNKSDTSSSDDSSSSSSSSNSEDEEDNNVTAPVASISTHDLSREPQISVQSEPKKPKKRTRNPNNWKRNLAKRFKNTGKEYISRTGKYVSSKTMGPPCSYKCRLSCSSKFSEEQRQTIFNSYWELGSLQRQRDFLCSCVKPLKVAYRRIKVDSPNAQPAKPRRPNTAYYFLLNGVEKRVCKTFVLNTLNIAERTLRTVIQAKNCDVGTAPQDKRGHHSNHSNLPEEIKQSIIEHIQSIPKIESHYLRASTSREFVDGGLTVSEMHRNYESLRRESNLPTAPYATYLYLFNTEFNIGFYCPKKDQCDQCVGYKNAPIEIKPTLEADYKLHLEEKSLSRLEKQRDMSTDNLVVATYDLQAVLPCPVGDSSAFFYKTRLNCYNFTVTTGRNERTTCYFWHEGLGHRGAIEIGSCVYKYLEELATNNPNCDVVFYSDNCCGQQKNKFILAMYYFAVSKLSINSITHKYLIRVHTQNEGDTAHSIIEKCIKRERKSGPIFVPDQYVNVLRKAKKSGNPFVVHEMNYNNFFDLKKLAEELNINVSKNINGDQIKLSEMKVVRFTKNKNTFEYKVSYKTENMLQANIITGQRNLRTSRSIGSIDEIHLLPAYNSKMPVSERKKQDILQLVEKNIVPYYYADYYRNL